MKQALQFLSVVLALTLSAFTGPTRADCQGGPVFVETVIAADKDTLSWNAPQDVEFVRGFLSEVNAYATKSRGALVGAATLDISGDSLLSSEGAFYLVKSASLPCGSWQAEPDAEPDRDILIHPPCSDVGPNEEEMEAAVVGSLVGLADPWGDPDEFTLMYNRIQDTLGCALEEPPPGVASKSALLACGSCLPEVQCSNVNYCGVQDSSVASFKVLSTGPCLNAACFQHDCCYETKCINVEGGGCNFSPRSYDLGCDQPLVDACNSCFGSDASAWAPWAISGFITCVLVAHMLPADNANAPYCDVPPCAGSTCDPQTGQCVQSEFRGYWPFEGSSPTVAIDASGNENNGSISGAVRVPGWAGNALNFNGNSLVTIANESFFDLQDEVSLEAWVKTTGGQSDYQSVVNKGYAWNAPYELRMTREGEGDVIGCSASQTAIFFAVSTSSGWSGEVLASAACVTPDQWYHVVGTYDGTATRIYVNGNGGGVVPHSGQLIQNDTPVRIGGHPGEGWVGLIDEVRIYSGVMSARQVHERYLATAHEYE